ncbi:MAG: BACON domain-containing protein [Bacteroidales bacterium]|nr:BACON domain-containing protein [Bacteroidales bacterium]
MMKDSISRLLCAAIALALCSCEGKEPSFDTDSLFVLEEKVLNIGREGGENIQVNYSISGPKAGNTATVICEESWISISKVYNSSFRISVSPNTGDEDRTARLSLSCDGVKDASILVIQSNGNGSQPVFKNFRIEVSEITTSTASVKVTPKDASVFYHYSVVSASDFESLGSDGYISYVVDEIDRLSAIYGTDPENFLNRNVQTLPASSLMDDTEYCVAVFDLSYDAQKKAVYSGELEKVNFRTKKAAQVNMNLELSMSGSRLNVKASASGTYIFDIMSAELMDDFARPEDAVREYVKTVRNANYGDISAYLHSGNSSGDFADYLEEGKKYIAWAAGYRNDEKEGGLTTSVFRIEFTY